LYVRIHPSVFGKSGAKTINADLNPPLPGAANRFPDSVAADPQAATALNVDSTRTLARLASAAGTLLIYISTDYVFPGRKGEAPYKTSDSPDPPNAYGKTKYEGEQAILSVTHETAKTGKVQGVILRVPLLYGHCEPDDKSKSAVHPLVDAVYNAQKVKEGEAKIKVDDWSLRFPTSTEDVGRVLTDISKLYLSQNDEGKVSIGGKTEQKLPELLQFSGQAKFTKYEMTELFGEILGLPIDNLDRHDPSKDDAGAVGRPFDSKLDTTVLKNLGIDVSNQSFAGWW
jgi:S-adenosylmethionine synthetase